MLWTLMTSTAHYIDLCLARLGTDTFAQAFCDFVERLGTDQIMVFSIEKRQATCLMSRHFSQTALANELAAMYLDGWYRNDPLLPELLASSPGTVTLRSLDDVSKDMDAEYRQKFFDTPGLLTKTTLLGVGSDLRLFISLYQTGTSTAPLDPDLFVLVGRLALLHFEQQVGSDAPALLDVLSTRERTVCLGILAGQKTELIAANIGVAPSTVVTYRKRAYSKLGISSRASLFALCRTSS
ncbi:LuxR family transcriptional regulator [Parasedimentitalea marina]|uniref:LuxR family transcriptional regulator n=1 Tax=Parasedimentitalea marina TaxID=2483033 RepID=A0A3T0N419_9RHOB|nr:helix-turn-helix transcriptional regulator [Parasedimentitalea marina]AZV78731.1 LuxR family transcriptional regulator [Parasedimentitalea marina]